MGLGESSGQGEDARERTKPFVLSAVAFGETPPYIREQNSTCVTRRWGKPSTSNRTERAVRAVVAGARDSNYTISGGCVCATWWAAVLIPSNRLRYSSPVCCIRLPVHAQDGGPASPRD